MKFIREPNESIREDELRLMIKVAHLHYREGWLQRKISKELGLSTAKVSTLLSKAVDRGLVEIHIHDPFSPLSQLEEKIQTAFNIRYVNVVPGPFADREAIAEKLGLHAALYLQRILRKDHIVGISGGSTLYSLVSSKAFNTYIPAKVVPIIGGVSAAEYHYTSNGIAAVLANQIGGTYLQVPFPTFVSSPDVRSAVMRDRSARDALGTAKKADIMVVGIGTIPSRVLTLPHISEAEIQGIKECGAVAEVGGHFLNDKGFPAQTGFEKRLIGIELDDIRKASTVIAVGGGFDKFFAIRSALLSGIINVLIIDEPTANKLIKE